MIGQSFQPYTEEAVRKRLNRNQLGPLQSEALRILSLRLPHVLSGHPVAPADLLTPRVGGAADGMSDLFTAIRSALGVTDRGPLPGRLPRVSPPSRGGSAPFHTLDDGPGSIRPAAPDGGRTRGPQAPAPPLPVPGSPYFRVRSEPLSPFPEQRGPHGGGSPFGY